MNEMVPLSHFKMVHMSGNVGSSNPTVQPYLLSGVIMMVGSLDAWELSGRGTNPVTSQNARR